MTANYQQVLGERLRSIRNQQGLTLGDVEERSGGTWKAVVIGSYERGDRAISLAKLARLAEFYDVPVTEFLPTNGAAKPPTRPDRPTIMLDLTAVDPEDEGPLGAVARFVQAIQLRRGDYNGRVLTIRSRDLDTVAAAGGIETDELVELLDDAGVLVRR